MLKTVFIVDDDPISNLVCETILKKMLFAEEYHTFENSALALEKLESLSPDLVFLDLHMPEIDGWTFLDSLENHNLSQKPKVILLTASIDPEDQKKAESRTDLMDIVLKPLSKEYIQELKVRIER